MRDVLVPIVHGVKFALCEICGSTIPKAYLFAFAIKVSKGAKIRNRYNQVPHLTQDTNGIVTNSQLDTTNESQEVSSFPASDHKAHINRRAQRHSKHKTEKNIKDPQKIMLCYVYANIESLLFQRLCASCLATSSGDTN